MIGTIMQNGKGATPWQIVAEGVFAKRSLHEDWPEVVVLQMLDPPYPVVVMEKGDSRWKRMTEVSDAELVMMAAEKRAKDRDCGEENIWWESCADKPAT